MPDVGVLNLQIHDDSAKAAEGLNRLATSLKRVQTAIGNGLKLGGIANNLTRINTALEKAIPEESIQNLERLAAAIDKINSAGGINIKGIKNAAKSLDAERIEKSVNAGGIESIEQTFERVEQRIEEINNGIDSFNRAAESTNQIIQNMGWSAGGIAEQFRQAFEAWNTVRMSGALGSGQYDLSTQGPQTDGWAHIGENFVQAEYTITDAIGRISGDVDDMSQRFLTNESEITEQAVSAASETTNAETQVNETLEEQLRLRRESLDLANQQRLENNYEAFRDLYMNGGDTWKQNVQDMYGFTGTAIEQGETYAEALAITMREVNEYVDQFIASMNQPAGNMLRDTIDQALGIGREFKNAQESASVLKNVSDIPQSMNAVGESFNQTGSKSTILTENLTDLDRELKEKKTDATGAASAFKQFREGIGNLISPLTGLIKQFARIAKYRMLRAVIKQITEGFKEGVENYYRYSAAIKNGFSDAMDSAASSLAQMKNSIGAAAAPLIRELIPYLQQAVNWFINVVNYANQFIALMRGQSTWSRATERNAKAFDDVKKSATGASAAVKDLLADWDELNIIQSDTGTTGGGGTGTKAMEDYLGMFEEVGKFDNQLKALMESVEKRFGSVWNMVKEIGVALLGWKISEAFTGILGTLGALVATGAIIDLVFKISQTFTDTYLKTGNVGWLVGDVLTTIIGATLAKKVLTTVLGGEAASIAIPLTFAVSAAATITALLEDTDVSALDEKSIASAITAALEGGTAAGYLAHMAGATLGESLLGGVAATLITFGVAIGLKAIKDTVDTRDISKDTIKADLLSAGTIGGGLAIAAAVAGGTAGTIVLAGGAGAIATFGLLIGIEALIAKDKPKKVMWGESNLTSEQISAWVNEKMYNINVTATVKKINTVIEDNEKLRKDIAEQMTDVTTDLNIIKLGLATNDTYTSLKNSVFGENGDGGVIGKLKTYAEQQKTTIKTSMTLIPIINENGEQDEKQTAEYLKAGLTGWTEVEQYMTAIGNDLSNALKEGSKNGLKGYDDELIAELTDKLTKVQQAITGAQLSSTATGNLMENISNLSQKNAKSIIDEYAKYQDELKEGYNNILKEELASFQSLEAFYLARGEEGDDKLAAYYHERVESLMAMWNDRLAKGVESASGTGKEVIVNALKELLMLSPDDIKNANALSDEGVRTLFGGLEVAIRNSDMQNTPEVKKAFQYYLDEILKASLTDADYEIVSGALGSGLLNYTDLFSQETIDALLSQWRGDNNPYKLAVQSAWAEMIQDALGQNETTEAPETTIEMPVVLTPDFRTDEAGVELEYETEKPKTTGKIWTTKDLTASTGARSGVYYNNNANSQPTEIVVKEDNSQQQANVTSGVKSGTGDLLSALRSILDVAQAINRKDFTVNINPTSMLGRVNSKSREQLAVVTGESVVG